MTTNEVSASSEHQSSAESNVARGSDFEGGVEAWRLPVLADVRTRADRIALAVRCASLAPSSHNSQPWSFHVTGGAIEMHADRTRALPVVDPSGRELVLSCGAALFQLALAARVLRIGARVETFPEGVTAPCVARLHLEETDAPTEEDFDLFSQMPRRRTYRMALEPRPVAAELALGLARAAAAEGATLAVIEPAQRARVSELVAEGNRRQGRDAAFRRELASWIRHKEEGFADGMIGRSFGLGAVAARAFPFVVRAFDWGSAQAEKDAKATRGAPLLAALTSEHDDAQGWLATGRALARVLLLARAHGLHAAFFNQPIQVPELRGDVAQLTGGHPQLLLRLGHAEEIAPSLRRAQSEILVARP